MAKISKVSKAATLPKESIARIQRALEVYKGDRKAASHALGITPSHLLRWMQDNKALRDTWLEPDTIELEDTWSRVPIDMPSPEEMRVAMALNASELQLEKGKSLRHALSYLKLDSSEIDLACSFEAFVAEDSSRMLSMTMGGMARSFIKVAKRADYLSSILERAVDPGADNFCAMSLENEKTYHDMLISTIETMRKINSDNLKGFKTKVEVEKMLRELEDRTAGIVKKQPGFMKQAEAVSTK